MYCVLYIVYDLLYYVYEYEYSVITLYFVRSACTHLRRSFFSDLTYGYELFFYYI